MPTRITPSQFRSRVRQLEQRRRQEIEKYNRAVRAVNQANKRAVEQYNRRIREYNARVRAHRQRLADEIRRLQQRRITTRYVTLRTSIEQVRVTQVRLEDAAERSSLGPEYNQILDLSEREAANSAGLMNALLDEATTPNGGRPENSDSPATPVLAQMSPDYARRWTGALFALNPNNPDAGRHFCASSREIFAGILTMNAPDREVIALLPDCDRTPRGTPTRRAKIRYILRRRGLPSDELEDFVEADMNDVVELFAVFNEGTHGPAGKFTMGQLRALRKRVEENLLFLLGLLN